MKEKTVIETYEEKRKLVSEFNLTSDLFAGKVFEDVGACKELCRILMQERSVVLQSVRIQYAIRNLENHSMELDILAERDNKDYDELPAVTMVYLTRDDIIGDGRGCCVVERAGHVFQNSGGRSNHHV